MRGKIGSLIGFLLLCYLVQAAASWVTFTSVQTWYPTLAKPAWRPPGWVFGPVWTLLYTLLGISAWMVWNRRDTHPTTLPLAVFGIQLALNGAWSFLFFGLRDPAIALAELMLLWLTIILMIVLFYRCHKAAGLLQIPYFVWVSYALCLNAAIVWMN